MIESRLLEQDKNTARERQEKTERALEEIERSIAAGKKSLRASEKRRTGKTVPKKEQDRRLKARRRKAQARLHRPRR